jgi:NAD(P)-dependent dehydrogenase (short-subunit alcohol dehydrogenase family)
MTTIVMTGGTSGIGAVAAHALSASAANRLVLGARGIRRKGMAARPNVELLALDLASLDSVRRFAAEVRARVGEIDALVLNAGVTRPDVDRRTVDGFETTFATNHLGHHLLLRLLRDRLAVGARVVLTTSGAHDPAERTRFVPPRHADARLLAHPELDPDLDRDPLTAGGRAYAASKLCAMLTARALAGQPDTLVRGLIVVAYCPGETPGTGVARELPWPTRTMWRLMGTPLGRLVPHFTTRSAAGRALAELALGAVHPPAGHVYAALRRGRHTFPDPSELAVRCDLASRLWHDSSWLVDSQPSEPRPSR